jgi:hypothetical protein
MKPNHTTQESINSDLSDSSFIRLIGGLTPEQLPIMQASEHLTELQLNQALRSQCVPPKGLSLA